MASTTSFPFLIVINFAALAASTISLKFNTIFATSDTPVASSVGTCELSVGRFNV